MKAKIKMPMGIGISSLVMMFIALTMASIISLTLMTSYRESNLTQKSIETTKAYYEAEAKANVILLEIGEIYNIYYTADNARSDIFENALIKEGNITRIELGEPLYIYYEVPVNERQSLEVILEIKLKDTDGTEKSKQSGAANIQIISWKVKGNSMMTYEEESFSEMTIF